MTKADLIDEVSRLAELTRRDSEVIVETIFESVVRSLRAGDKIEIRGFGSFRTRQRKPRVGRNPKTGDRVEVPAKKIPYFKPSKELGSVAPSTNSRWPATSARGYAAGARVKTSLVPGSDAVTFWFSSIAAAERAADRAFRSLLWGPDANPHLP